MLRDGFYGEVPIQIGYCKGENTRLNCLEYHRDSEVNVLGDNIVLLVAAKQDIEGGRPDTGKVEAFFAPADISYNQPKALPYSAENPLENPFT